MKKLLIIHCWILLIAFACNNKKDNHQQHAKEASTEMYTCPMPQDSIFSEKPGTCPKCGMDLVKMEHADESNGDLNALLQPTNEYVVSSIPVTTIQHRGEQIEIESLGKIIYDTREVGMISARVSGRIEKLYVRHRYQKIEKGQRIMDIYSPEILTAQQNILFLLKNDPTNLSMIEAAKQRLQFLGLNNEQIQDLIRAGKPALAISVYSNYSGHIHEAINETKMIESEESNGMKDISLITEALSLKEGMYIQKGQSVFSVFNPRKAWALLNIYGDNQSLVKTGNVVRVSSETNSEKEFRAQVNFIEPFYSSGNKTLTARVYFDNSNLNIPIGSQVKAVIFGNSKEAWWLPKESVLSLGMDKVVFKKENQGFKAVKVSTGILHKNHIQIISGVNDKDSVAENAQFLMDSESFIKANSNK